MLQQQVTWISERLDAKCREVSRLQVDVYRLRAELRGRGVQSKTASPPRKYAPIGRADLVYTKLGGAGTYWRDTNEETCPGKGVGCAWGEAVSILDR